MKKLFVTMALVALTACAGPKGTVDLSPESTFSRTALRVADRCPQEDMDVQTFQAFLQGTAGDISVQIVGPLYDPVEDLHDLQVLTDPGYDTLEQEVYIGDTQALRGLLDARGYVKDIN